MTKFLKEDFTRLFVILILFSSNVKAMDLPETSDEILIESKEKYPKKIFNADSFIMDIEQNDRLAKKPRVRLDLSNDISLNSRDVRKVLDYFTKKKIKIDYLNISNTNVDENIVDACKNLTSKPYFKYLDISGTPAAETKKGLEEEPKVIFFGKSALKTIKEELEKTFGKDTIDRHINYYDTVKSFTAKKESLKD